MIEKNAKAGNKLASKHFAEWTFIFPERLFVMLIGYVDESYTSGGKDMEKHIAFGGYVAPKLYWQRFCKEWSAALKYYFKHDHGFFHFREFANKKLCAKQESPYFGWSEYKRDEFLYRMATIAGNVAVPFGGNVPALQDVKAGKIDNPIEAAIWACFEDLRNAITLHWPTIDGHSKKDRVHIIFDHTDSDKWLSQLHKTHAEFQRDYPVFGHITSGDDKEDLPLQAADMASYAGRQQGEKEATEPRLLDLLLYKNTFPKGHIKNFEAGISRLMPFSWNVAMNKFREHQKEFKKANPKEAYLPLSHYPFEKHFYK